MDEGIFRGNKNQKVDPLQRRRWLRDNNRKKKIWYKRNCIIKHYFPTAKKERKVALHVCVDRALLLLVSLLTWIHDWCSNYKKIVKSWFSFFFLSFFLSFFFCFVIRTCRLMPPHLLPPFYSDCYTFMTPECNVITAISAHCSAYLESVYGALYMRLAVVFSSISSSPLFSYSFWNIHPTSSRPFPCTT